MLAIDIGPMIDRGLDDNCGPISACYIGPKIAPDYTEKTVIVRYMQLFPFSNLRYRNNNYFYSKMY